MTHHYHARPGPAAPAPTPTTEGRPRRRRRCQGHRSPTREGETTGGPAIDTSRIARHRPQSHTVLVYCEGERIGSCEARSDRLVGIHYDDTRTSPAAPRTTPAGECGAARWRGSERYYAATLEIGVTSRPTGNSAGVTRHCSAAGLVDVQMTGVCEVEARSHRRIAGQGTSTCAGTITAPAGECRTRSRRGVQGDRSPLFELTGTGRPAVDAGRRGCDSPTAGTILTDCDSKDANERDCQIDGRSGAQRDVGQCSSEDLLVCGVQGGHRDGSIRTDRCLEADSNLLPVSRIRDRHGRGRWSRYIRSRYLYLDRCNVSYGLRLCGRWIGDPTLNVMPLSWMLPTGCMPAEN